MNKEIQGLESYSYDEIVDIVKDFVTDRLYENGYSDDDVVIKNIKLHGSRLRNQATPDSDLDIVIEYEGDISEDDLFNLLHDEDPFYIDNVFVDVNPIKEDIRSYMKRSDMYDLHKLNKVEKHCMKRKFKPTLEERVSYLESTFLERKKRMNEVGPVIAKIGQLILKNLPLILNALPSVIKALETDQMNDNSDKIDLLKQFGEIGEKVGEMFKNANG